MSNFVEAFYSEQIIDDYKGNPFIEALPQIMTREEVIDSMISYPKYDEKYRELEDNIRIHVISQKFTQIFQPLSRHIDLERKVSMMIRNGYVARNPISIDYTRSLIKGYK